MNVFLKELHDKLVFVKLGNKFKVQYYENEGKLDEYVRDRFYEDEEFASSSLPGICAAIYVAKSENDDYEVKLKYDDSAIHKSGVKVKQEVPSTKALPTESLTKYF